MKGGLWSIAGCVVIGALLSRWLPFHPLLLLGPVPGLLFFKRVPAWVWMLPLCVLFCCARMVPGPRDLQRLLPETALTLELEFVVAGDPVRMTTTRGSTEIRAPVWARRMRLHPEFEPVSGRVQVRIEDDAPAAFLPGSRWLGQGRFAPESAPHTGLRGATGVYKVRAADLKRLPSSGGDSLWNQFFAMRERLAAALRKACEQDVEAGEVLLTLLLGQRGDLDEMWMRRFAKTGLIHLFAISGLHLGLLTSLLLLVFRRSGLGHRWRWALVLPALFLFTACTGFRASAIRALIMAGCVLLAPMFNRREHLPSAFAAAASLILLYAPEQLVEIGFQFSFLLVAGLMLMGRLFDSAIGELVRGDPWAPTEVQRAWWKRRLLHPLLSGMAVSAICFVVSSPLTAHRFNLFSPISLLGNLLAVPLAFLLLASGFLALPFLMLPGGVGAWVLLPARWSARGLLSWVELLEQVPHGVQWVRAPPLWMLLIVYTLPVIAVIYTRFRKPCLAGMLTLAGFAVTESFLHHRRVEAVVIDADRGQAAWFRNARGEVLLVDAGSDWSGWHVREALQREGIDRIAACIFTHADRRHVEGIHQVLQEYKPNAIYVPVTDVGHPLFENLTPIPVGMGDLLKVAGWEVDVLWPPEGLRSRSADERSLVLRIRDGFASALVMGGADERVEAALLEQGGWRPARVMLAAHSQGKPGASVGFLQAVNAESVVFSGAAFGEDNELRKESEARVAAQGIPVWRVPSGGLLRIELRRGRVHQD